MKIGGNIEKILSKLPDRPGVYTFRDETRNVLYVGKAKSLKSRVRSYFQRSATLEPAKRIMVGKVADIEYIIVDSETEALLLESTLIKKHRPPFNVIFKDDKYYQYIRIALMDDYPRVDTVRRVVKDGGRYYGPFTSGYAVRQTLQMLKRIFPYKSCKEPPGKPCFDARLGRCLGHDTGRGGAERYRRVVKGVMRFLEGHADEVLATMKKDMRNAARARKFEIAARLRDRIIAIERVTAEQKVVSTKLEDQDVIGMSRLADLAAINLFQIRNGKLMNRQYHILQHTEGLTDSAVVSSFLEQYYPEATDHPSTVVLRAVPDSATALRRALALRFEAPTRGKKRKLVVLAEENARDWIEQKRREWLTKEARARLGLTEIQHALLFPDPPRRIECFDVSNIQGTDAVGSMVVFEDGLPKKSDYRKFTIRGVAGINDYAMMQEIVRRRFAHHRQSSPPLQGGVPEGRGGTSPARGEVARSAGVVEAWPVPDLVIIDGGKGQLNAALAVLRELDLMIPTVGLAKRLEELFRPGSKEPLRLPRDSEGLFLLQRIRDEAHRFAIGTFRARHRKESSRSLLDEVPGIGPTLRKKLLARFGSVDGIRSADDSEITAVIGKHKTEILREHM